MAMKINRKKRAAAALLTAAAGCMMLTGCGHDDSETSAERAAEQSSEIRTETTLRTERSTVSSSQSTGTTKQGLIDRAESALDSLSEDVTSILREGTREVHPFD